MQGNPHCSRCRGRGGYKVATGWRKCECVTGTKRSRHLLTMAHVNPDKPRLTVSEMVSMGSSKREGGNDG